MTVREGLFLYERGLDPYDGGIFHQVSLSRFEQSHADCQAPIFLPLFSLLPSSGLLGTLCNVAVSTLLDTVAADSLYEIAASGAATTSSLFKSPRHDSSWSPVFVAGIFLLNPFTLLSCLAQTTTPFTIAFSLLSVRYACEQNSAKSAFALAFASYISLHPFLLLPTVALLCYDRLGRPQKFTFAAQYLAAFAAFLLSLILISRLLLPSWKFLSSVYLTPLTLPDLTPNPGLWWYFFIEMFDAFREFFLGVFWLHMLAYSVPFCLRLHKQPLAAVVCMLGVIAVFQPYANVGDAGCWLACLSMYGHLFALSSAHRYSFPAMAALLYAALLGPAFHYLWIYAGSGNANFFYAITLVWSLALLVLLTDFVYALLRDEWESERPSGKDKEARQI